MWHTQFSQLNAETIFQRNVLTTVLFSIRSSNGSLDTTFGTNGITITDLDNNQGESVSKVLLQSDGKFVVTGFSAFKFAAARYNSNGTLDSTFGTNGRIITPFAVNPAAAGAALQSDGKIVIFGVILADFCLIRLNANGTVDTTLGTTGQVIIDFNNTFNNAFSIAILGDGKILVGGNLQTGTNQLTPIFARFNSNGTLDSTFGTAGKLEISVFAGPSPNTGFYDLAVQPDGKIIGAGVAAGGSTGTRDNIALARLNADGTLDTGFGTNGTVKKQINPSLNSIELTYSVNLQADGKIVVGVTHQPTLLTSSRNFAVVRFNSNGSIDNTFGTAGVTITDVTSGVNDFVYDSLIQPDGKIVLSGVNQGSTPLTLVRYLGTPVSPTVPRTRFDFDGDGKADVSVFRPSNGTWYLQQSTAGFTGLAFGLGTDKLVPADYDGDGKTDVAVYRSGTWYLQRSQLGFTGTAFGAAEDIPVPADYDGDGKADVAVFRPSNGVWYLQRSQLGFTGIAFGQNGDKPVPADYDGDGKADIAVNRNGIWYLNRSQLGFTGLQFGDSNDKLVPADYDGDGKADVAVFRPSNGVWYLQRSQLGFTGIAFGLGTDLPVAADYDGDGKSDIAVFRDGIWYLNRTTQGFTGVSFGAATDKPIPNAFVP